MTVISPFSLAARFGVELSPTTEVKQASGGFSGAKIFKLSAEDSPYALRGWPDGTDPRGIRGLHRLLQHVAAAGVPVAVPLRDSTGASLAWDGAQWWQIEPWLPGDANFRTSPTDEKLQAAMETLAGFHNAASTFAAIDDERLWFGGPKSGVAPVVSERRKLAIRRLLRGESTMTQLRIPQNDHTEFAALSRRALRGCERLGDRISNELAHCEGVFVPLLPVLRDAWHDHVLFTNDSVTGLIDASACRRDTVAADLSRLLGSLLGDDLARWDAALQHYQRYHFLSDEERLLVPVLDRSGVLLSAMTWVRRRYLFNAAVDTPPIVARLRSLVDRIEHMRLLNDRQERET